MIPSDFPSPEAIEAADLALIERGASYVQPLSLGKTALEAAMKAQPVVALPPCPTCEGSGTTEPPNGGDSAATMLVVWMVCPSCKGSGVDRLIPVSEIRAFIDGALKDSRGDRHLAALEYRRWLDERGNGDDV